MDYDNIPQKPHLELKISIIIKKKILAKSIFLSCMGVLCSIFVELIILTSVRIYNAEALNTQ